jgi:diguanylate cyclase (GGDEF)-like protein/PAS domain S-box-containing protein
MRGSVVLQLQRANKVVLWLMSVALALLVTEATVSVMQWLLLGTITWDYLVTGMVASVLAASLVSGLIFYFVSYVNQISKDNAQLSAIINACPMPLALNDHAHRVVMLNPAFVRVFGYTLDDIPTLEDWWPKAYPDPIYRKTVADRWRENLKAGKISGQDFEPLEVRVCCKDGSVRIVMASATPLELKLNGVHLVLLQDVTQQVGAAKALAESRSVLQTIIETIPMRVFWKDRESRYLGCNTVLARDGGELSPADVIGKTDLQLTWRDQADRYRQDDLEVMERGQSKLAFEEPQTTPDGRQIWLRTSKVPLQNPVDGSVGVLGIYEDITERKVAEAYLRVAATAFESQEGMVIVAANGKILRVNQSFTRITGYTADEAVGQTLSLLKSGAQGSDFYASMWERIGRDGHWQGEIQNRRKNGEIYTQWLTITAVKAQDGDITHYVGTMLDISDRKAMERKVHHLAHHDALTDLPNRVLLTDRMNQALAACRREKTMLALLYLDLDRFKPVNDTLGHEVGDLLLKQVALRLRASVSRESDTVSRIGGDEFVLLLTHVEEEDDASAVAQRALDALNQPFAIGAHTISISTSIGIALYPEHGADPIALMKSADNAMYQAKNSGRSCYRFFRPDVAD